MSHNNSEPGGVPAAGLVYHAGALGDFVLSLPAVFRVVQAYPDLQWSFWGPPERLALLPGFGAAPPELLRSGHTLWGDSPAPEAVAALRGGQVILAFGGRVAPAWWTPPGPRVLGVASFPPRGGAWVPAHQGRQLEAQGVAPPRTPWFPSWRREVLPHREAAEILLHPGSGDPRKNVPAPVWAEVLGALRVRTQLPVTLVLGPAERERGGWEALSGAADRVRPCESLTDLLAVLARARLFLGNDAGATHLSAALGIASVAVFGPSDPTLWRPMGPRIRVVRVTAPCAPCTGGGPVACRVAPCWENFFPAGEVVSAAVDLLAGGFAQ
ncbi:MAG: glycosyltransferase family 9 protein [Thermodesulfobacteriota bacterium]